MGCRMEFNVDEVLRGKIGKIKLFVLDVDGVLTDGRIIFDSEGRELKFFDVQDGLGIRLLKAAGIKTILITLRASKVVERRARDLGVEDFYEGIQPKTRVLKEILEKHKVREEEICYVGDDLVDLGMMKVIGFPVAVMNGCQEIKEAASYITQKTGGRGAVREVAELILRTQGRWHEILGSELGLEIF